MALQIRTASKCFFPCLIFAMMITLGGTTRLKSKKHETRYEMVGTDGTPPPHGSYMSMVEFPDTGSPVPFPAPDLAELEHTTQSDNRNDLQNTTVSSGDGHITLTPTSICILAGVVSLIMVGIGLIQCYIIKFCKCCNRNKRAPISQAEPRATGNDFCMRDFT